MTSPSCILLFAGKRKSGKDYITEKLRMMLGENCEIIRISQPIKSHWAKHLGLDLELLLSSDDYKEKYRADMVKWSENMRAKDYGYFCRAACEIANHKKVWIVSDIRRKTDLQWFKEKYEDKIKTIKIIADINVRKERGWSFVKGVDDAETECNLDDVDSWDFILFNNNKTDCDESISKLLLYLQKTYNIPIIV